jgi:aminocarboxymuconate-semialdehyde decarboxylase
MVLAPRREASLRIDVHNHVIPDRALRRLRSDPVYRVAIRDGRWQGGNHVDFALEESFVDPGAKLAQLERNTIDGAIISAAPPLFYYELDEGAGEVLCRATNEGMREFAAEAPARLWWMAHVPLQAPERAAALLEEAVGDGCVGVQVGSCVAGARLDEERFEPFWAVAERLGVPVTIHPDPSYSANDGLGPFYLANVIGMPLETTIAIKRLIGGGVLARHPGLRLVLLHGGGYFPYQAGRMRHAGSVRPELAAAPRDPWQALDQLSFDVITHDVDALRYLVERVGLERVLLGTDLPFDMALPEPLRQVEDAVGAEAVPEIAERNPVRLFNIPSTTSTAT